MIHYYNSIHRFESFIYCYNIIYFILFHSKSSETNRKWMKKKSYFSLEWICGWVEWIWGGLWAAPQPGNKPKEKTSSPINHISSYSFVLFAFIPFYQILVLRPFNCGANSSNQRFIYCFSLLVFVSASLSPTLPFNKLIGAS